MNELKEKMNNIHGITLVALVVTIVVLLILAGVSISTLTGENGILTRATQAKEDTTTAATGSASAARASCGARAVDCHLATIGAACAQETKCSHPVSREGGCSCGESAACCH